MLTRVARDALLALGAIAQADGLLEDRAVADAHRLLENLVGQDFDIDKDNVPRLHRGTRPDRIVSTVDTEMRHGRKSAQTRFDGYKLSATATNTPVPLITAVEVAPASEQDGRQAKHLIDNQPPQRRPKRVLGDTAYGNGLVRAELTERDVEVLAPVPTGKPTGEGRLAKRDFHIDFDAATVTCPAGHTVDISISASGFRGANFPASVCRGCPLKDACCPNRPRRQLNLGQHDELLQAGRRALDDPARANHLRRTRPRIERLLGLLAHRYGTRKSRYIGAAKARLQAAWAAALVNLNPIAHALNAT